MQFEENYIYHIYNQGSNRRKMFFFREKYSFFLKKIETYICPYADILAVRDFNKNIGIMLTSYTRTINKQENFTGSLFRKATKALCLNCPEGLSPSFYDTEFGIMFSNSPYFEQDPPVCFNYIHQNPVEPGLVKRHTDWEFSSARDYAGLRDNTLVNKLTAGKYLSIRI